MLTQPHPKLGDRAAIDVVTPTNMPAIVRIIMGAYQRHEEAPEAAVLRLIPEDVLQRVSQLVDNAMAFEGA
ncbi:hypothetical protein [Pectobacterium cacticida]|uniref:hypothetical protein n=1 Tax=Pectobacterium cacticida TaxID=69221 RepID=UPI003987E947